MDITRSVDATDPPGRHPSVNDERAYWNDFALACVALSAILERTRLPARCDVCGRLFICKSQPRRYCSKRCQAEAARQPVTC